MFEILFERQFPCTGYPYLLSPIEIPDLYLDFGRDSKRNWVPGFCLRKSEDGAAKARRYDHSRTSEAKRVVSDWYERNYERSQRMF